MSGCAGGTLIETITLSSVAATTLKEGIKFLYSQAGEALRTRRKRKQAAVEEMQASVESDSVSDVHVEAKPEGFGSGSATRSVSLVPTTIFRTDPGARLTFDSVAVEELAGELTDLRHALADYADDIEVADPADTQLLAVVDALRRAMEAVSGARLTFRGERRATPGPQVSGHARIEQVRGVVAVLRAEQILSGSVTASAVVNEVAEGGQLDVLRLHTIGIADSVSEP